MLPDRIKVLTHLLMRLPGVGEKTALRFALHFVTEERGLSKDLGEVLGSLSGMIRPCDGCGNLAEVEPDTDRAECEICRDPNRDRRLLCVVAKVQDLLALEASGALQGRYFVLGQLLSPLDGVGPERLPLSRLMARLKADGVTEVIIATPPSVDGEATGLFLARELAPLGVTVTRIASGIPHGGDLEYADRITLGRAIQWRRTMDSPR